MYPPGNVAAYVSLYLCIVWYVVVRPYAKAWISTVSLFPLTIKCVQGKNTFILYLVTTARFNIYTETFVSHELSAATATYCIVRNMLTSLARVSTVVY